MRDDPNHGGQQAYKDCRETIVNQQGGLCAYCEVDISDNHPAKCHVEHFHPKSDRSGATNWHLAWGNLLGVCNGGSNANAGPTHFRKPLPDNLSCDAHTNREMNMGRLPIACEGWILNPLDVAAFPCLFSVNKGTGDLLPDTTACQQIEPIVGNQHASVAALVQHTIDMLNLNCPRLSDARLKVIRTIEKDKADLRSRSIPAATALPRLVAKYFRRQWPPFFTTRRFCLAPAADQYLRSSSFQG